MYYITIDLWYVLHSLAENQIWRSFKNPQRRKTLELCPDYIIKRSGKNTAILDAQYYDLWQETLPLKCFIRESQYFLRFCARRMQRVEQRAKEGVKGGNFNM